MSKSNKETLSVLGPSSASEESVETRRPGPFPRRERRALAAYVREVADALGLRDWTIEIDWELPCSPDAEAEIEPLFGRRFATMQLSREFRVQTPENQRYLVCHELIHCHLAAMDDFVARSADAVLGSSASGVLKVGYNQHSEAVVDALAAAFAETMPLPEIPSSKRHRG